MKSKLLFSFLFLSSFVVAQVPLLTPFSTHKQSRITEISNFLDNLPSGFGAKYSDRIAWNSIKKSIDTTKIISQALSVLNSPMPPWNDSLFLDYSKTGLRAAGEKMYADRQNYLTPLVWAECIENKGRFTPFIINALKSLVTQPTWRMPASYKDLSDFYGRRNLEVDLGSADLVTILSQSLYFLDDKVDAVTHQQVVDSIYSRVLNPFKKTLDTGIYNYWLGGMNNIPAYCFSGIVGAALAVIQNKQERALFVAAAEYYSQNYLLGYTADGYCKGVDYS